MNMPVTVPVLPEYGLEKHQITLQSYLKTEHLDYWSIYFQARVEYQDCDLSGCNTMDIGNSW
jgi:hypothetical protein